MISKILALGCVGALLAAPSMAQLRVVVDQVGYEQGSSKQAIVVGREEDRPQQFTLINVDTGNVALAGAVVASGKVADWGDRVFWAADFSACKTIGHYELQVSSSKGVVHSSIFEINTDILERDTLSNVVFYFKSQRSTGLIDEADRHLPLPDGKPGVVDVHGGWYDATGDYGIHLSHQNPTSYFNPQQVPLVAWSLGMTIISPNTSAACSTKGSTVPTSWCA
jgi:hypothetical protein